MLKKIDVPDLNDPMLDPYVRLKENQLIHYFEPEPGLFLAESPKVIGRALNAGYMPHSLLMEPEQLTGEAASVVEMCEALPQEIPLYVAEQETLRSITGYGMTRGAVCAMYRRKETGDPRERWDGLSRIVVLEGVVNPTNVGAIFRSAAALGADGVILAGGCADPLQRRSVRVSMGTVFQVPWMVFRGDPAPALRQDGFYTVAMALQEDSVSICSDTLKNRDKLAVFLGTEGEGLRPETIASCDACVMLPMSHGVDSLNVAAAAAVAFWELWGRP